MRQTAIECGAQVDRKVATDRTGRRRRRGPIGHPQERPGEDKKEEAFEESQNLQAREPYAHRNPMLLLKRYQLESGLASSPSARTQSRNRASRLM
jgi:hypothetical protein